MNRAERRLDESAVERLRWQIRQLILLRETGPKSAAWHAARSRLIWRLQDELRRAEAVEHDVRSGEANQTT